MGMMYGGGPGGPNGDMPEAPRDRRGALSRGTKALVIVALLVCVVVLGTGSLIVSAASGDLHVGGANVASKAKSGPANPSNAGAVAGDAGQNNGPDIIPTCDCQTTQVSSAALQLSGIGKEILVSTSTQQLSAYQDGQLQFTFLVATGRPGLPTPVGKWHVQYKEANITFYSPWPQGSNL